MLMFIYLYMLILLIITLMIFMKFNKHMLLVLMSLEFFVVSMFFMWFFYFNLMGLNQFISLYYLIFSVCESVLGLTVMVLIMRGEGNDYFNSLSLLKW
uniref:NADH-ubiquinone oxidoreductase chain 4L n=1 Tax=Phylloecus linearis TaxID=2816400 RepID=A0A1W6Q5E1_9HYME|nr:NADH dehydrogenase subunit 4L [Phylloecus linearis]